MIFQNSFLTLYLHNNFVKQYKISKKPVWQYFAFIINGVFFLPFKINVLFPAFPFKSIFVNNLGKSLAGNSMYFHRHANDSKSFMLQWVVFIRILVFIILFLD